jgi:hypothetical protein
MKVSSSHGGISLLPTTYKILPSIFSMLIPYVDKIIGDHRYGFRRNRIIADQIFICQILQKKWEYNVKIRIAFGTTVKPVRLIKIF